MVLFKTIKNDLNLNIRALLYNIFFYFRDKDNLIFDILSFNYFKMDIDSLLNRMKNLLYKNKKILNFFNINFKFEHINSAVYHKMKIQFFILQLIINNSIQFKIVEDFEYCTATGTAIDLETPCGDGSCLLYKNVLSSFLKYEDEFHFVYTMYNKKQVIFLKY